MGKCLAIDSQPVKGPTKGRKARRNSILNTVLVGFLQFSPPKRGKNLSVWYHYCMRTCTECGEEKLESEFYWKDRARNKLQSRCKDCQKARCKIHYNANKQDYVARNLVRNPKRRKDNLDFVNQLKSNPCTDCGETFHHAAMQYDHIADNKRLCVSEMVVRGYGQETILKEIEKCELVCGNCHAIRTLNRRDSKQGLEEVRSSHV